MDPPVRVGRGALRAARRDRRAAHPRLYRARPVAHHRSLANGGDVRQVIIPPAGLPKRAIQRMSEYRGRRQDALNGHATNSGHILEPGVSLVDVKAQPMTPQQKDEPMQASGGPIVHPRDVIETVEDIQIRNLASQLSMRVFGERTRRRGKKISPGLARRLRDFQFAQEKRRAKYGDERPWGILGLYDHLATIRIDVEWAEDAAYRRNHNEPYLSWAFFDEQKSAGFNQPFFTYFLLVACTVMLIASIGVNGWKLEALSVNPMLGPSAGTLIKMGAKEAHLIVHEGEGWRLITPMFLHAGIIHYAFNMLALWFVGSAVEQSHGSFAAATIFVIPAIGGTILSGIFLPEYISVGASGGIFGLIGACVADIVLNWSLLFSKYVTDSKGKCKHIWILIWLLGDIIFNSMLGLTPFIDNFTHMGGMVYGFFCGISTLERLSMKFFGIKATPWQRIRKVVGRFSGLIIAVIALLATTVVLLEGDTSPCQYCRYVSCMPFPPWKPEQEKWWHCDDCAGVSADARLSETTGKYDELLLLCPDGTQMNIQLAEPTNDKMALEKNLPSFCRQHCLNVYRTE